MDPSPSAFNFGSPANAFDAENIAQTAKAIKAHFFMAVTPNLKTLLPTHNGQVDPSCQSNQAFCTFNKAYSRNQMINQIN
jgi:hypothetical protein